MSEIHLNEIAAAHKEVCVIGFVLFDSVRMSSWSSDWLRALIKDIPRASRVHFERAVTSLTDPDDATATRR